MDGAQVELGWDRVMGDYHAEVLGPFHPGVGHTVFDDRLEWALEMLAARRGGRALAVLDAGCGPGNLLGALERAPQRCEVVGVDGSVPALEKAAAAAAQGSVPARFVRGDLADLRLPATLWQRYDLLVAVNSVLPPRSRPARRDVQRIFEQLAARLVDDGIGVFVLPAHDALVADLERSAGDDPLRRRRAERAARLDRHHRLADNGFSVPQAMHDLETMATELPGAGLRPLVEPQRLVYPPAVARRHGCHLAWDWCVAVGRS